MSVLSFDKQVVISGEIDAIKDAILKAKVLGIRRAIPLNVSGAFHSPLMQKANVSLKKAINSVNFGDTKISVYQNVLPIENFEGKKIKRNLFFT